eukprot:c24358_g3_i1 orf=1-474(-)
MLTLEDKLFNKQLVCMAFRHCHLPYIFSKTEVKHLDEAIALAMDSRLKLASAKEYFRHTHRKRLFQPLEMHFSVSGPHLFPWLFRVSQVILSQKIAVSTPKNSFPCFHSLNVSDPVSRFWGHRPSETFIYWVLHDIHCDVKMFRCSELILYWSHTDRS